MGQQKFSCSAEGGWGWHEMVAFGIPVDPFTDDASPPDTPPSPTPPAPWTGQESLAQGQVSVPYPAAPTDRPGTQAIIEEVVEAPEATALRCQIDLILAQLPPTGSTVYSPASPPTTLTPPDPAVGSPAASEGEVCDLAQGLIDANIEEVAAGRLAPVAALVVADNCLFYAGRHPASAGVPADRVLCQTTPIFSSGADVPEATDHDIAAQTLVPAWAMLHYEEASSKLGSRTWYESQPACQNPEPGQQCDEFPFWATLEGGGDADPLPSLQLIDGEDNERQGGLYGAFVAKCRLQTGHTFLSVPLPPATGIPTTSLCNAAG